LEIVGRHDGATSILLLGISAATRSAVGMRKARDGKSAATAPVGTGEESSGAFRDCTPEEAARSCGTDVGIAGVNH